MSVRKGGDDSEDEGWSQAKFSYESGDFGPIEKDDVPSYLKKRFLNDGVDVPDSISHKNRARIIQLREYIEETTHMQQEFNNAIGEANETIINCQNQIKRLSDNLILVQNKIKRLNDDLIFIQNEVRESEIVEHVCDNTIKRNEEEIEKIQREAS